MNCIYLKKYIKNKLIFFFGKNKKEKMSVITNDENNNENINNHYRDYERSPCLEGLIVLGGIVCIGMFFVKAYLGLDVG